jgi:serine/threonine protein kinase
MTRINSSSVVGEGSYGCVHKPRMECSKSEKSKRLNSDKYISKFMLTKDAITELSEYTTISNIDKKKKYYLGKPLKCKPKKNKYNLNSAKKCDIYEKYHDSNKTKRNNSTFSKFSLLIIPDGGLDISKFGNSLERESVSVRNNKLKMFWKDSKKLFYGIMLFQKHGILHHDVKPQNILFDGSKLRFIDFGLMRKIKDVEYFSKNSENYIAEYPFWSYPFEFAYLNRDVYMKIAGFSIEEKNQYILKIEEELKDSSSKISIAFRLFFDYILNNSSEKEREQEIQLYLNDFVNFINDEMIPGNYEAFLEKSLNTIDLFGVGITLKFMLSFSKSFFDSDKINALNECFFNMMRPSVVHRYNTQQAVDQFTKIMESHHVSSSSSTLLFESSKMPSLIKKIDNKTRKKFVRQQEDFLDETNLKMKAN